MLLDVDLIYILSSFHSGLPILLLDMSHSIATSICKCISITTSYILSTVRITMYVTCYDF